VTLQIVADLVLVLAAEETVRAVEGEEHGEVAEEEADHRGRLEEESAGDVGWIAEPEDSDVGGEGRAQQQRSKERCHNANAAEYGGKGVPSRPFASLRVPSRPFASLRVPSRPFASLRVPSRPFASLLPPVPVAARAGGSRAQRYQEILGSATRRS
jgi:hypothetical protein